MSSKRQIVFRIAMLIAGVFFAQYAWAVVGTIRVTDDAGNPVPEAEIKLPDGTPVGETGPDGTITVEEGTYVVVVPRGSPKTIKVNPGETTTVEFPRSRRIEGTPPVIPGSNVTGQPHIQSMDDITRTKSTDEFTFEVNGTVVETGGGSADEAQLVETNEKIVQALDIKAVGAGVTIALGAFGGSQSADSALGFRSFTAEKSFASDSGQSLGTNSRKIFYPSVSLLIGRAEVDFEFSSTAFPEAIILANQRLEGDGLLLGIGGGALFFFGSNSNWFGSGAYSFERISDVEMVSTPRIFPADVLLTREDWIFDYDSHTVEGIVGYNFAHVAPFGGVRRTFRTMTLQVDFVADSSQKFPGFTVITTVSISEEEEENTVEGVAGMDFRFGHFVAGVEGSFDQNNFRIRFRGGFGF